MMELIAFSTPNLFFDRLHKDPAEPGEELWFIFKGSQLLVHENAAEPFQPKNPLLIRSFYMGKFKQSHLHVGELSPSAPLPAGSVWKDLRTLYGKMDEALFGLAGRAVQLVIWDQNHQFCGQCGNKMIDSPKERAKECPICNILAFPKVAPVVMALIQRGDEILLARSPGFPPGVYSVLAGFVNPAETLEQCLKREVLEEVGLEVEDLKYFGSQSWPFPNSLLVAFTCQWKSGEIVMDPVEIEDAQWFKKENLPPLPSYMSLARLMIDKSL
ncbi:MAG: NAD(+) diphosphatase [Verrucomicrobia bacterium]|nr:NAD(+) diphosphatase [Verrucomicrobiota bacterium]